jgi:hypothetical protein
VEPLCKNLRGGRGYCRKYSTLREAIIAYELDDEKTLIPYIGHF